MNEGPRWLRLGACVGAALLLWFLPPPEGLGEQAWHTFAVFVGVVAGFLLRPLDMAPIVLIGLTTLLLTKTVDLAQSFEAGFGNKTVWLVVIAFFIAGAVERTGLGHRIALHLIRVLGKTMLGLGYAIAATELALGPFVPSNTARGGGIISPIVRSLARTLGAESGDPAARRTGAYLAQTGSHSNLVVSATFLTAMAGNLLMVDLARDTFGVEWDFATWLQGAIVPGLCGLAVIPVLLKLLCRPDSQSTAAVQSNVKDELKKLGEWSPAESMLSQVLLGLLVFWSLGKVIDVHPTTIALAGVLVIVLTGAQTWKQIVSTTGAWDALIWLGGFVALADALKSTGFTLWLRDFVAAQISSGLSPTTTTVVLALIYFFTMFFFSQLTAHITALAGVFLALAKTAAAPPLFALAIFSYFSCLCGAPTPWSSGPVIIYFGFGYESVGRWIRNGIVVSLVQIPIWIGVGMLWWSYLGWL